MICKTDGIVITSLKYSETSIIARVFTRELGMQSYLVRGARKARSRNRSLLFQPLTIVHMVVYHTDTKGLHSIKEIGLQQPLHSIPLEIHKTAVVLFLSEVLYHALKNQEANAALFDELREWIVYLDRTGKGLPVFHLAFLLRLSSFLGFQPRNNHDENHRYFNLQEGVCEKIYHNDGSSLNEPLSDSFLRLCAIAPDMLDSIRIPKEHKKILLRKVIEYYRLHVAGMPEIQSLDVLETVFEDSTKA